LQASVLRVQLCNSHCLVAPGLALVARSLWASRRSTGRSGHCWLLGTALAIKPHAMGRPARHEHFVGALTMRLSSWSGAWPGQGVGVSLLHECSGVYSWAQFVRAHVPARGPPCAPLASLAAPSLPADLAFPPHEGGCPWPRCAARQVAGPLAGRASLRRAASLRVALLT
jgi:hypothetical protein